MFKLKNGLFISVFFLVAGLFLAVAGCFLLYFQHWILAPISLAGGIILIYKGINNFKKRTVLMADSQGLWYDGRMFKWDEINTVKVETRGIGTTHNPYYDVFCFETKNGECFEVNLSQKNHNTKTFIQNINNCAGAEILSFEECQKKKEPFWVELLCLLSLVVIWVLIKLIFS